MSREVSATAMGRALRVGGLSLLSFLAVVGLLWIGSLVIERDRGSHAWGEYRPKPGTEDHLLALSGGVGSPVLRGGRARLLVGADMYVPALMEQISGAKSTIHLMTYVWQPGQFSDEVLGALEERALAGVTVRLLLDGHGGRDVPEDRLEALREAGLRVAVFSPLELLEFVTVHKRNHQRAIVVDGEVAFVGGVGIADEWLDRAGEGPGWRDDLSLVTGPLARSVQSAFAQTWFSVTGELLTGPDSYPSTSDAAPGEFIALHVPVSSAPSAGSHPLRTVFWLSFATARERIWITNPYFVPTEEVRNMLAARARDGVDVRLVTAGAHVDIPWVRWAAQHRYAEMLEAGVRVFEYEPTLIHSKRLVVDGTWSVIGSANLDIRSIRLNHENVLTIVDEGFAAELEGAFEEDLAGSKEILLEDWAERGVFLRAREWVSSLLESQL